MANPFLIEDTTSSFADSNNTFNPFVTNTTAELESHNDNPFFSSFGNSNSISENTNPFLSFTQKSEIVQPVADLISINDKPQTSITEDDSKIKPPPPRPAPPKRPPPRPTPPSQEIHKELILSVTGEMDATSLHLLDRLPKTPSPIPMRDLLSPSPTPTADLLGCDDLQPPIPSQSSINIFDHQSNVIDNPSGTKPERPKFPPKIDFLMDDLLEDVPIDEGVLPEEISINNRTPSVPENLSKFGGSNPTSRKTSNDFILPVRRLSHDVTESRKIMPDLSKIADRRKSDIGNFAPILPLRKSNTQNEQSHIEIQSYNVIQEINEDKLHSEMLNNVSENKLVFNEKGDEQIIQEEIISISSKELNSTLNEERKDIDSQHILESCNDFIIDNAIIDTNVTLFETEPQPIISTAETSPFESANKLSAFKSAAQSTPFVSAGDENLSFNNFDVNTSLPSSDLLPPTSNGNVKHDSIDAYDAKPIPPVPDPSPFQEIPFEETSFNADKLITTTFDVQEPQQMENSSLVAVTVQESFPITSSSGNDAFDAFAAKFDDSQNDSITTGAAFDAFGSISGGAFDDSAMGFGADDNFDSFLSTHQIPAAPQSTPAKVTRNNSGESLDENEFNVFIKYCQLYFMNKIW